MQRAIFRSLDLWLVHSIILDMWKFSFCNENGAIIVCKIGESHLLLQHRVIHYLEKPARCYVMLVLRHTSTRTTYSSKECAACGR